MNWSLVTRVNERSDCGRISSLEYNVCSRLDLSEILQCRILFLLYYMETLCLCSYTSCTYFFFLRVWWVYSDKQFTPQTSCLYIVTQYHLNYLKIYKPNHKFSLTISHIYDIIDDLDVVHLCCLMFSFGYWGCHLFKQAILPWSKALCNCRPSKMT